MIYIYFYVPKDSEIVEVIGSFTCDEKDYNAKMEEVKTKMPKEMKEKGYRTGGFCISEDIYLNKWELHLSDLRIKINDRKNTTI